MKIDYIKTMIKVGSFSLQDNSKKLNFIPDEQLDPALLKDKRGRVYSIVVDKEIKKIGGSQDKGGIIGTIGWYLGGFAKGNSERTYCTWNYIRQNCINEKTVELYAVWAPMVKVTIPTMTGEIEKDIPVDFHSIEKEFNDEYYKMEESHPYLNMQESGSKWEDTGLMEGYINKDGTIYKSSK